jgi:hypothetical protein
VHASLWQLGGTAPGHSAALGLRRHFPSAVFQRTDYLMTPWLHRVRHGAGCGRAGGFGFRSRRLRRRRQPLEKPIDWPPAWVGGLPKDAPPRRGTPEYEELQRKQQAEAPATRAVIRGRGTARMEKTARYYSIRSTKPAPRTIAPTMEGTRSRPTIPSHSRTNLSPSAKGPGQCF